jgi:hypothetical protein
MSDLNQNKTDTIIWCHSKIESLEERNLHLVKIDIQLRVDMTNMRATHIEELKTLEKRGFELADMAMRKAVENCEVTIQTFKLEIAKKITSIYQEHEQVVERLELSLKEEHAKETTHLSELHELREQLLIINTKCITLHKQLCKERDSSNAYMDEINTHHDRLKEADQEKKMLVKKFEQMELSIGGALHAARQTSELRAGYNEMKIQLANNEIELKEYRENHEHHNVHHSGKDKAFSPSGHCHHLCAMTKEGITPYTSKRDWLNPNNFSDFRKWETVVTCRGLWCCDEMYSFYLAYSSVSVSSFHVVFDLVRSITGSCKKGNMSTMIDMVTDANEYLEGCKIVKLISEKDCSICLDPIEGKNDSGDLGTYSLDCGHVFHKRCLWVQFFRGDDKCPLCRNIYTPDIGKESRKQKIKWKKMIIENIKNEVKTKQDYAVFFEKHSLLNYFKDMY